MNDGAQLPEAKILVVDDRPESLKTIVTVIKDAVPGALIYTATSGSAGLSLLVDHEFALVLLDVQMPNMTGLEMAELMRGRAGSRHVPIVFLTAGVGDEELLCRGYEAGAVDFIYKPFEPAILRSKVRVFVELDQSRRRLRHQLNLMREAEASRAETELRLRLAVETASVGVWEVDLKTRAMTSSATCRANFGRRQDEAFSYEDLRLSVHVEDLANFDTAVATSVQKRRDYRHEYRILWPDGSTHWIVASGRPRYAESGRGEAVAISGVTLNVTTMRASEARIREAQDKQAQAEQKLRVGTEHIQLLQDNVRDFMIFSLDNDGFIIDWNVGAERLTLYTAEEMVGKPFGLLFTPEDRKKGADRIELETARTTGRAEDVRWHARRDGSRFWANGVTTALYNDQGVLRGFAKVARDQTVNKLAEEALIQSEKNFRLLAELMPHIVWTAHRSGLLQYSNLQWSLLTKAADAKASSLDWTDYVHPDSQAEVKKAWAEARISRNAFERELQLHKGGSHYGWFICRAVPVLGVDGGIDRWIGTMTDIDDQKLAQQKLIKARSVAEEASLAKSKFLAHMSHEIRTPLGAIVGFSDLLQEGHLEPKEAAAALDTIRRNASALTHLINDILDLSKVEAGHIEVEKIEVDLPLLISEIVASMSVKAREKALDLVAKVEADVPQIITTDPTRLRQILLNVVGNALKFTSAGQVTMTVRLERGMNAGAEALEIVVSDTGCGLALEQAERIFRPFVQADSSVSRTHGGTGLGLALSRQLAQALGGRLVLQTSKPGAGSTFVVSIDARPWRDRGPGDVLAPPHIDDQEPGNLRGFRVLIADDAPDNQILIRSILHKRGAEVEIASDGYEAIAKALHAPFDAVLMDMQMPLCDGYEATLELRRRGFQAPIIAVTANAMREERDRSLAAGCSDHLTKPINPKALVAAIKRHRQT